MITAISTSGIMEGPVFDMTSLISMHTCSYNISQFIRIDDEGILLKLDVTLFQDMIALVRYGR